MFTFSFQNTVCVTIWGSQVFFLNSNSPSARC